MAKNEQKNILGQSGNFHRKTYIKLFEEGLLKKEMGAAEQKRIIEAHYKKNGFEPSASDLTQIYNIGFKKISNLEKEEQGNREILTKEEKIKKDALQKNEDLAAKNTTGKRSTRNENRRHNRQYEEWKYNKYGTAERNNADEFIYIKEYLEYLKNEKGYSEKTLKIRHEAIHKEQEDIFRKGIAIERQQLKMERHFTNVTQNRRIPITVSKENIENYLLLSARTNNIFKATKTANRQGDIKKYQQQLVFDTYLAEVKSYKNHNQISIDDVNDFFQWLQSDKKLENGKVVPGVSNKTAKGYKTTLNQYSVNGKWKIAKELNNIPLRDFGVGRAHTKVVERALSKHELDKALDLAKNGTTKNKTNVNEFVYYTMLLEVGAGVRSDESINLTVKQLKDMLAEKNAKLHLTKTKGSVKRTVPEEVLKYMDKYLKPCNELLEKAITMGLKDEDKIMIEAFPENKRYVQDGKTHLIKHRFKDWIRNHRDKFQDADRLSNREITRTNDKIEHRKDIEILRGDITSHSFRHTFATTMFHTYKNAYDELFATSKKFRSEMFQVYYKERTRDNKTFTPNPEKMDYYTERGYYMFNCLNVSALLGHGRYDVTETYIVTKNKEGTNIAIELDTFEHFTLDII